MTAPAAAPPASAATRAAGRLVRAALAGLALASVAGWLAPLGWPFELFVHFRLQLAAAAVLLVPLLLWAGSRTGALLAVVFAAVHWMPGARGLVAAPPVPACAGAPFEIVAANVKYTNRNPAPLLAWLARGDADVVVLEEVTPSWSEPLARIPAFPHVRILPRDDPYGMALLSRWPFEEVGTVDLAGDGMPSIRAVVRVRGEAVQVLGVHTRWPVLPNLAGLRDRALDAVAARVRSASEPTVVVGDLNLTADSPVFVRLLATSGLHDAFAGRGWQPTWRAGFWPLALRIDHVLASPTLCVEQAEVGPDIGSDHRPVAARLRLPRARG